MILEHHDWVLDTLMNEDYVARFTTILEYQKEDPSKNFLNALVTGIQTTGKFEVENGEDTYQRIIVLREPIL